MYKCTKPYLNLNIGDMVFVNEDAVSYTDTVSFEDKDFNSYSLSNSEFYKYFTHASNSSEKH